MSEQEEVARLRGWIEFYAQFCQHTEGLHGIAAGMRCALAGDPPPKFKQTEPAIRLAGIEAVLADLFGSYHRRELQVRAVRESIKRHLGP